MGTRIMLEINRHQKEVFIKTLTFAALVFSSNLNAAVTIIRKKNVCKNILIILADELGYSVIRC